MKPLTCRSEIVDGPVISAERRKSLPTGHDDISRGRMNASALVTREPDKRTIRTLQSLLELSVIALMPTRRCPSGETSFASGGTERSKFDQ